MIEPEMAFADLASDMDCAEVTPFMSSRLHMPSTQTQDSAKGNMLAEIEACTALGVCLARDDTHFWLSD